MLTYIDINKIKPHPDNPRKDLGDLTELADSIKANGILQNLTVVPWFSEHTRMPSEGLMDGHYRVVIGHRRHAAAKLAGLTEVPCKVVEMTPREQVATMLLENMQRNDLTIYEQAQGFQMMLDFGDSIEDIAAATGFSKTTVKHRVKLMELDQDKFKKATERGGTIQDYIELEKIENVSLRNSVLEKIGTQNFKWELERAIEKEKTDKNMAILTAKIEKFAAKLEDSTGMRYVRSYYPSRESSVDIPADSGTVEYYFEISQYGYITLYTKYVQKETAVNTAQAEKQNELRKRKAGLENLKNQSYKLRLDFIRNFSYAQAKKNMPVILEYAVRALLSDCFDIDCDDYIEYINVNITKPDDEEDNALTFKDIRHTVVAHPELHLLLATCCKLDSDSWDYYSWDCTHEKNDALDLVYDFLEKLGYEMSDEERQLRDGTHELYDKEGSS